MDINLKGIIDLERQWSSAKPFSHIVIDNFLPQDIAEKVAEEFPDADSDFWYEYANPLEIKKACSDWNKFPPSIYQVFNALMSDKIESALSILTKKSVVADSGLHGGGLHCHKAGGKLNTHLDYSMHPKLNLQRKVNIIIYVSKDWDPSWDGALGFWENDSSDGVDKPGKLIRKVDCVFNRAVIFDTTQNSWHGLPDPVLCPDNRSRNSLATYYLCEPPTNVDERAKALYAPAENQKGDEKIAELIKKRASLTDFSKVYKVKD